MLSVRDNILNSITWLWKGIQSKIVNNYKTIDKTTDDNKYSFLSAAAGKDIYDNLEDDTHKLNDTSTYGSTVAEKINTAKINIDKKVESNVAMSIDAGTPEFIGTVEDLKDRVDQLEESGAVVNGEIIGNKVNEWLNNNPPSGIPDESIEERQFSNNLINTSFDGTKSDFENLFENDEYLDNGLFNRTKTKILNTFRNFAIKFLGDEIGNGEMAQIVEQGFGDRTYALASDVGDVNTLEPKADNLVKAVNKLNSDLVYHRKVYTSLSQMGLSKGCSINNVIAKMSEGESAYIYSTNKDSANHISDAPIENQHAIIIFKTNNVTFTVFDKSIWGGNIYTASYKTENTVDKWYKISPFSYVTVTGTATTSANGNIGLPTQYTVDKYILLSIISTNNDYVCMPYTYDKNSGRLGAHVRSDQGNTGMVANKELNYIAILYER